MGFLQQLRDRFLVAPVAEKILQTLQPTALEKADVPKVFSVPVGFNNAMANYNKRMISNGVDWPVLRSLSINHETSRAAINARKRQITQLGYDVVDVDDDILPNDPETTVEERQKVRELITNIGGPGVRFREVLDKLMEDTLVLDACVFYKQRARGGKLLRIIPIDATTIKLRVDDGGARPMPPDFAFEQWIRGEKVADLTTEELTYEMMNPRTDTPYGLSPLESLIITLDSSMRAMLYNLSYLSDNSVPQGFMPMPEGWTVNQIKEFTEYLHSLIAGPKAQAKIYPIPSGAEYQATSKPTDFAFKDFFDYLDRKVCMMFDITPQELGLSLQQYKENAEGQDKIQVRKGIKPLANFLQEIFTDIIRNEFGYPNYAFKFVGLDSRFEVTEAKTLIPLGVISVDEVRNDMGLKKLGVDNFVIAGKSIVPLAQLVNPTTISGTNPTSDTTEEDVDPEDADPSQKTVSAETLKKLAINLGFEAVSKKKEFKSFNKATREALTKQIEPFTKEATIDKVTEAKKDDLSNLAGNIDDEIDSIEIQGLNDYLLWSAEQGGQNAYKSLNIEGTFKLTNPKFKEMLGERSNYLIQSVDNTTKDWIIDQITEGKANKLTNAEIAQSISDQLDDISSARADMIVNTEVANAMQTAELGTYKEQGVAEKMWVTSEDEKTCSECAANDGQIVKVDEIFGSGDDAPPLHPDCRCYLQAVVESIGE